jgi:hypothetical protein
VQPTSAFVNYHTSSDSRIAGLFTQHHLTLGESAIMGKKKDFRPKKATNAYRMYPSLHRDVAKAVFEDIETTRFHNNDSGEGCSKEYSTFVVGVFVCNNNACSGAAWSNGKITLTRPTSILVSIDTKDTILRLVLPR